MSQFDAADALGVSLARIGFLIQGASLEPVHNAARRAGVTVSSVEKERRRREGAGPLRRAKLFVVDVLRSLAGGI